MRDDFSEETKRTIANRVGHLCSRPACRALTSGPQVDPTRALNVGVASHITAASSGGPRYDPALSADERRHPDNAIWLCQSCGKLVDNDEVRFPAEELRAWKRWTEQGALERIGRTTGTFAAAPDGIGPLLTRVQSRAAPISVCLAEALDLARRIGDKALEDFTARELLGWYGAPGVPPYPKHRQAKVYISLTHEAEPAALGWGGDSRTLLREMERAPEHFIKSFLAFPQPVSALERDYGDTSKSFLSIRATVHDFLPAAPSPDAPVFVYGRGDTFQTVLEQIRAELTRCLVQSTSQGSAT